MEIRAYSEIYLESAQNVIGHMFDFAINEVEISPQIFSNLFITSPYSIQMEKGNPTFVAGKTGPELVRMILEQSGYITLIKNMPDDVMYADRSPEYWAGWALAYYQWKSGFSFRYILNAVPFTEILKMYPVYHEMDITRFVKDTDEKLRMFYNTTALRRHRELRGLTQQELSDRSGVSLRQIQLFEQKQRDICKAQAATVFKLSRALGCDVSQLLLSL